MNAPFNRQRGMTLWGWLVTVVVIGVFALIGLKLVPVYMESFEVGSIVSNLAKDSDVSGHDRAGIMSTLMKRFDINDVDNVHRSDVQIIPVSGGSRVVVEYEVRVPLMGNLSAVAHFKKEAVVSN